MICSCERLIKKRTLLDGIKSISGVLQVFTIGDKYFLRQCCFITIIPSLYTFVDKDWLSRNNVIVNKASDLNNEVPLHYVHEIEYSVIPRIQSYALDDFSIEYIQNCQFIESEYNRLKSDNNGAYQKIIELEKLLTDLNYKYSSVVYDNNILKKNISNHNSNILEYESKEPEAHDLSCIQCKSFDKIKKELKQIKHENYEKIAQMKYTIETNKNQIIGLKDKIDILSDENVKLKDANCALYLSR